MSLHHATNRTICEFRLEDSQSTAITDSKKNQNPIPVISFLSGVVGKEDHE